MNSPPVPPRKRMRSTNSKKCYSFQKGNCQFGDSCRFRHELEGAPVVPSALPPSASLPLPTAPVSKVVNEVKVARHITAHVSYEGKGKGKGKEKVSPPPPPPTPEDPDQIENPLKNYLTQDTFRSLPISQPLIKAIEEVMGYSNLTIVQSNSLPPILAGNDCLGKAKTGTGKTLAFLIPSVENMLRRNQEMKGRQPQGLISTLVISPTRELANQIGQEATKLLHFLPNQRVVTLTGGTNRNSDVRHLVGSIAVLVATPGRLVDHLDNTEGVGDRCRRISTFVLDEADILLEMGFKPALDRIMSYLTGDIDKRQTLLFSATVSPQIQQIAQTIMKSDYSFIDTVGDESNNQTHEHVQQNVFISDMENLIPSVLLILRQQIAANQNSKIIVFFTTARVTGHMATFFRKFSEFQNVLEIHSRKSQSQRTKASEQFRTSRYGVLFSSDVSARGMDYPDVTFVLQVGLTEKEQYIHRLGRTARAGKTGTGTILLYDFEETFMLQKTLKDLEISRQNFPPEDISRAYQEVQNILRSSFDHELRTCGEQAYQAWLGFYNSNLRACGWNKANLVMMANRYAQTIGFTNPPALEAKTIGKMGLKGIPGLNIQRKATS